MRDRGFIYAGLAVFVALATFPVWSNLAAGATTAGPKITLPANEKQCIEPTEYMRTSHMKLLVNWREQVVRNEVRDYVSTSGKHYNLKLTPTCLEQCHQSKAEFCDRCHTYMAVAPSCWDCHLDAQPTLRSAR